MNAVNQSEQGSEEIETIDVQALRLLIANNSWDEFYGQACREGQSHLDFNNIHAVFFGNPFYGIAFPLQAMQMCGLLAKDVVINRQSVRSVVEGVTYHPNELFTAERFVKRIEGIKRDIRIQEYVDSQIEIQNVQDLTLAQLAHICEQRKSSIGTLDEFTRNNRERVLRLMYSCAKDLILEHGYTYTDFSR